MKFAIDIAVWTGIIQAFLMPVLLIVGGLWFFVGTKSRKTKIDSGKAADPKPKDRFDPLNCSTCGASLAFDGDRLRCTHCSATEPVPESYKQVFELRGQGLRDIHEASRYLNRARVLTSGWLKGGLILAGTWLFVSPFFLLITASDDHRYDTLIKSFGNWVVLMGCSQILWIIILFLTAINITKVSLTVPKLSDPKEAAKSEFSSCPTCGGGIQFGAGDLATLCGFCGVETFRPQVSWAVAKKAKGQAQVAQESLAKAQLACERAVDEVVGSPSILIFIFVYLPLIIFLPAIAWHWIKQNPLPGTLAILGLIGIIWAVVWFRKQKSSPSNLPK